MTTRPEIPATGAASTMPSSVLSRLAEAADAPLPSLFIGHGSPTNALERNAFTESWRRVGAALPRPRAILCVSAHWETPEPMILTVPKPETIHDFHGFSDALNAFQYPAPGAPDIAREAAGMARSRAVGESDQWGLDHGTWSVLAHLFPDAEVPTFQLSLGRNMDGPGHLALGRDLSALRGRGVLILGSGNLVHNLPVLMQDRRGGQDPALRDWAEDFDNRVAGLIEAGDFAALADLDSFGPALAMAHPTLEHYLPLLYTLGAAGRNAEPHFFAEGFVGGSLSMRSLMMI